MKVTAVGGGGGGRRRLWAASALFPAGRDTAGAGGEREVEAAWCCWSTPGAEVAGQHAANRAQRNRGGVVRGEEQASLMFGLAFQFCLLICLYINVHTCLLFSFFLSVRIMATSTHN